MKGRRIIKTNGKKFFPYEKYGLKIEGLEWIPINNEYAYEKEIYLIRFKPKSHSRFHLHKGMEEFYVLEGELIDEDGEIFEKGDFVIFEPGTKHSSYSRKGCTLLVMITDGKNHLIDQFDEKS